MLAWLVVAAHAHAEPDLDPTFAACKARRRVLTREAMQIADMIERGRKLALMPICRRFEDSSIEIVGPLPPPPPIQPVRLRPEAAVLVGYGTWQVGTQLALPAAARAPFLELEAGARVHGMSFLAFAGYAQVTESFDFYEPFVGRGHYDARDTFTDGGLKVRCHYGAIGAGIGAGVEQVHDTGNSSLAGPREDMHELGLVEGDLGYTAIARDHLSVRLLAIASGALGDAGSVWSARVALSVGR